MLKDLFKRLEDKEFSIEVTDEVKDYLANEGYSEAYGARPLRRLIQKKIEDGLAEEILMGAYKPGDKMQLVMDEDKKSIAFKKVSAQNENPQPVEN